ncbi:MAG: helix-turn-helix domain-containing protein [Halorhodospira sp.]
MARSTPTELYHTALRMHRQGHTPEEIADELAVHRDSVQRWLQAPVYPAVRGYTLRHLTRRPHPF